MKIQIHHSPNEVAILPETIGRPPRNLLRAIATDVHFWIPLGVLLGGLALLDRLR